MEASRFVPGSSKTTKRSMLRTDDSILSIDLDQHQIGERGSNPCGGGVNDESASHEFAKE